MILRVVERRGRPRQGLLPDLLGLGVRLVECPLAFELVQQLLGTGGLQ